MAEVEEVVDQVEHLYTNWPDEWGPAKADQISVVTPYSEQVQRIRMALRERGRGLGSVTVERVMNVQGKHNMYITSLLYFTVLLSFSLKCGRQCERILFFR